MARSPRTASARSSVSWHSQRNLILNSRKFCSSLCEWQSERQHDHIETAAPNFKTICSKIENSGGGLILEIPKQTLSREIFEHFGVAGRRCEVTRCERSELPVPLFVSHLTHDNVLCHA